MDVRGHKLPDKINLPMKGEHPYSLQSGDSILRTLIYDDNSEKHISMRGDKRVSDCRAYATDFKLAYDFGDRAVVRNMLHQFQGKYPEQFSDKKIEHDIHTLFKPGSTVADKEYVMSKAFQAKLQTSVNKYDEKTLQNLTEISDCTEQMFVCKYRMAEADRHGDENKWQFYNRKYNDFDSALTNTEEIPDPPEYLKSTEQTNELGHPGQPGLICRHDAPILSIMLTTAGIKNYVFSNTTATEGVVSEDRHAAVISMDTYHVFEATEENPELVYGINQHPERGPELFKGGNLFVKFPGSDDVSLYSTRNLAFKDSMDAPVYRQYEIYRDKKGVADPNNAKLINSHAVDDDKRSYREFVRDFVQKVEARYPDLQYEGRKKHVAEELQGLKLQGVELADTAPQKLNAIPFDAAHQQQSQIIS